MHRQEPKDISPSSTTPLPTTKTANELVCFIFLFMLWIVYCVMCILYHVLYFTICLYRSFYVVYVLSVQLLWCHNYNKHLSLSLTMTLTDLDSGVTWAGHDDSGSEVDRMYNAGVRCLVMWKTRTSISVDSTHTALTAARSHHSSLSYQLANKAFTAHTQPSLQHVHTTAH